MNNKLKLIIKAVELLPENQLDNLLRFIESLKVTKKLSPKDVPTIDLGGVYDDVDVRELVYDTSLD